MYDMFNPAALLLILIVGISRIETSLTSSKESVVWFIQTQYIRPDRTGRIIQNPLRCKYFTLETMYEAWEGHNQVLLKGPWPKGIVSIFFDAEIHCRSQWIINFTSNVWKYMQATYGNFGPSPELHLVIHEQQLPGSRHMYSLNQQGSPPKPNMLDLGHLTPRYWTGSLTRNESQDLIANKLAYFVEFSSKNRSGSPSYNVWKYPNSEDTAWVDIFTYDVYKTLNLVTIQNSSHAQRYKEERELISYDFPRNNTFWFRDWFLPIYENYGWSAVLNRYFQYLHDSLSVKHNLTMGEFVHFWSAAAGSDLKSLAENAFGWNDTHEEELDRARIKYDNLALLYNVTSETTTKKVESSTFKESPETQYEQNQNSVIIGASVSISMFLVICALTAFVVHYKKKVRILQTEIRSLTNQEVKDFFEGDSNVGNAELQTHIQSLPFVKDFQISRDQLILSRDSFIGSGEYGCVMRGFLSQLDSGDLLPVAVKTVKPDVEVPYFKAMLSEAKVMAYLGKHDNIVLLCGTYTANIKNREIYIALELCALGDLQKYLKVHGKDFRNLFSAQEEERHLIIETNDVNSTEEFTTSSLLKWSHKISSAMMYLTEKRVIHGDLAARNVLLTANRVAKVSDLGLSRQLLNYDKYLKTSKTPLPWTWMAMESLKDMEFSVASDVWAFGVTLWEIFSLGETPYPGWTWDYGFVDRLVGGDRLQKPSNADNTIFKVMMDCWKLAPSERPSFETIWNILNEALQTTGNAERNYIDLSSMQVNEIV